MDKTTIIKNILPICKRIRNKNLNHNFPMVIDNNNHYHYKKNLKLTLINKRRKKKKMIKTNIKMKKKKKRTIFLNSNNRNIQTNNKIFSINNSKCNSNSNFLSRKQIALKILGQIILVVMGPNKKGCLSLERIKLKLVQGTNFRTKWKTILNSKMTILEGSRLRIQEIQESLNSSRQIRTKMKKKW